MANKIKVLDGLVASKIAAGEVIERPASVVKELLENALDSGATSIMLRIEAGGRDLIEVIDNGCGISAGDAPLTIMRHATSKIGAEEDLLRVKTLGFRGEALASIAAVSRLTITTRESGATAGARLTVEGGGEAEVTPAGCSEGTSVEVRDLFFNTPVRLKFLRSPGTESGRIMDVFKGLALVNPHVRFSAERDIGRDLILPVCTLKERLSTISALDKEQEAQLTEIVSPHIEGYIGAPEQSYATAKSLYTYLNGRPIKDRAVGRALIDGYGRLLPRPRYPLALINLRLPPADVDVNIHPAKTEVRFKNPGAIYSLVRDAVRKALAEKGTGVSPAPVYYGGGAALEGGRSVTGETGQSYYRRPAQQSRHGTIPQGLFTSKGTEDVRNPEFLGLRIIGQVWDEFLLAESFGGGGEGGEEPIFYLIDQHGAEERHAFSRLK
ncbi:MAG: DNA mismatch repair endonuclease MutL, partial [Thermodesulfobacteriota bacterium]